MQIKTKNLRKKYAADILDAWRYDKEVWGFFFVWPRGGISKMFKGAWEQNDTCTQGTFPNRAPD